MRTLVLSDAAAGLVGTSAPEVRPDTVRLWTSDIYGGGVEATTNRFVRHRFRPHTHDTLMLGLIDSGTKSFARERECHFAPPGSVSLVNPGELHTGERLEGAELRYRALYIPPDLLALAKGRSEPEPESARIAFHAAVVSECSLFESLVGAHDAITRREPLLVCETLLLEAIATLVQRHARWCSPQRDPAAAPREVRFVRELIDARFCEELSIGEVAHAAGLSPYHLMRQFRRFVGIPIHAYQIQRRIEMSKRLLASGEAVVDVALDVGFADQSHFSKRFRDLVGTSPAAYQRGLRD